MVVMGGGGLVDDGLRGGGRASFQEGGKVEDGGQRSFRECLAFFPSPSKKGKICHRQGFAGHKIKNRP